MPEHAKTVLLPKPRGFCAGVIRAIDIVEIALERLGAPVYVRKEIVHNRFVVDELAAQGAIFVEDLKKCLTARSPFSARMALRRCSRRSDRRRVVASSMRPARWLQKCISRSSGLRKEGYSIILIGHRNHDEVIGTFGEAPQSHSRRFQRRRR